MEKNVKSMFAVSVWNDIVYKKNISHSSSATVFKGDDSIIYNNPNLGSCELYTFKKDNFLQHFSLLNTKNNQMIINASTIDVRKDECIINTESYLFNKHGILYYIVDLLDKGELDMNQVKEVLNKYYNIELRNVEVINGVAHNSDDLFAMMHNYENYVMGYNIQDDNLSR